MKANHFRVSPEIAPKDPTSSHGFPTQRAAVKRHIRRLERRILNASLRQLVQDFDGGVATMACAFRLAPSTAYFA